MKFSLLLPLAAVSSALVIPDEAVMSQIPYERHRSPSLVDKTEQQLSQGPQGRVSCTRNVLESTLDSVADSIGTASSKLQEEVFDAEAWLASIPTGFEADHAQDDDQASQYRESVPHSGFSNGRRPRGPFHEPHQKPNMTVYELIASSKYTTKLAKLIEEVDLVDLLNGTSANFTIFAPIDKAFEKIPKHSHKPSKELIKALLTYHVSGEFYPAGKVLVSHTIPSLLPGEHLSEDPEATPQRLSINIGLNGLTVDFYSHIIAIDIFGTNGVIHAVDSIIIPPPKAAKIIELLPSEFSTLELGLVKTGLFEALNDTSNHLGGTLFAPSNFAFKKLGYKINAFLFSKYGEKYLKALLEYHVVANQTLYSDAFYKATNEDADTSIPKGVYHVDLPTLLKDRSLSIDIARFGPWIDMRINGFSGVAVYDGVAKDGVIHSLNNVLIPPKKIGGELVEWDGEELEEEDLKERLEPFVDGESDKEGQSTNWEL